MSPSRFREALSTVAESERDAWVDRILGTGDIPDDGKDLPRGCVPYIPAAISTLLAAIEHARIGEEDVFVDVGCGLGRALAFTHLYTGADAIGVEIQSNLAERARAIARNFPRVTIVEGDAVDLARSLASGTVFFLYCPFSGERLERVLGDLESIARTRVIRVCACDLPLPNCSWLERVWSSSELAIYESDRELTRAA